MKIFTAAEIQAWDEFTIREEPVNSIDLMERAAERCVEWIEKNISTFSHFNIYCGKGNNGGDGLAIARLLAEKGNEVQIHILEFGFPGTDDFQQNLARLHQYPTIQIQYIQSESHIYPIREGGVVIDALYGTGLNRKLEGLAAQVVQQINKSASLVLAIDIPSGLFCDQSSKENATVQADHTLSFTNKLAFYVAENASIIGQLHLLDIQLHPSFYQYTNSQLETIEKDSIFQLLKKRNQFSHKGNFGHGLLIAGSVGKMGAAVLAAQGALRAGIGLLTCQVPGCGYLIMQTCVPEAMVSMDEKKFHISGFPTSLSPFDSIGIGPGIGQNSETAALLESLFEKYRKPIVLDADALNIISAFPNLLMKIPPHSILTPHPGEFNRLFGISNTDFDFIELAIQKAKELEVYIVLKGHHSFIACPSGIHFFNTSGNSGMSRGGSGDVLTGIITSLIAQGYSPDQAVKIGVFLHGLAGDIAANEHTEQGMRITDLIYSMGAAWKQLIFKN
jgi:hydroxyethylthiazole kinase-like uncharacterized protein yjeF